MEPKLALSYGQGGGNGPAGVGWSVQGLSMVTRCPATLAIDSHAGSINFNSHDKLCLDGQRLIPVASGSGAVSQGTQGAESGDAAGLANATDFREYRTEKDSYARIRAYGNVGGNPANGPAYFKVWTKSGLVYEYGSNPTGPAPAGQSPLPSNAQVPAQGKSVAVIWAISRISDSFSNYADFKYWRDTNVLWGSGHVATLTDLDRPTSTPTPGLEWGLLEVQYSGNSSKSQAPTNRIVFEYSASRSDSSETYHLGSKSTTTRLLTGIASYANGSFVRKLKLGHSLSKATQRRLLTDLSECVDAAGSRCLPKTQFSYTGQATADGSDELQTSTTSLANESLIAIQRLDPGQGRATKGVIPLDIDGDGKTDLLLWDDNPALNKLWRNKGNAQFESAALGALSAGDANLYKSDGCFATQVADLDNDGYVDLLRSKVSTTKCGSGGITWYRGQGRNGFVNTSLQAGPKLTATMLPDAPATPLSELLVQTGEFDYNELIHGDRYEPGGWISKEGKNYHFLDFDGDGRLDILYVYRPGGKTTAEEGFQNSKICAAGCNRLFKGNGDGSFAEVKHNLDKTHLYVPLRASYFGRKWSYVTDFNGDGKSDLMGLEPAFHDGAYGWVSLGILRDGVWQFEKVTTDTYIPCTYAIDFNGDGRADCLDAEGKRISHGIGNGKFGASAALGAGVEAIYSKEGKLGVEPIDFNGDGFTDLLVWNEDRTKQALYRSLGNGKFAKSPTFAIQGLTIPLRDALRERDFVMGNFTGAGGLEILTMSAKGEGNKLLIRAGASPAPDQLHSVQGPTGLKTTVSYVPLTQPEFGGTARYVSDLSLEPALKPFVAQYPQRDLTAPMLVVAQLSAETGVGDASVKTDYAYRGLKVDMRGRGMLGFRETRQMSKAADDSDLTVSTQFLLEHPYTGLSSRSETRRGNLLALLDPASDPFWKDSTKPLSRSQNIYCDASATPSAGSTTVDKPCPVSALIQRPYLWRSVAESWDLVTPTLALPSVETTNEYNGYGDPTRITVKTSGVNPATGTLEAPQKIVENEYCAPGSAGCPNNISGDNWILGRLSKASVRNIVPGSLASTSAGNQPNASAISGSIALAAPTLEVTLDPSSLVADQVFTEITRTTNASSLKVSCTAAAGGYTLANETRKVPTDAITRKAEAAWVGKASNCTWTATGGGGSVSVSKLVETVNVAENWAELAAYGATFTLSAPKRVRFGIAGTTPRWVIVELVAGNYSCTPTALNVPDPIPGASDSSKLCQVSDRNIVPASANVTVSATPNPVGPNKPFTLKAEVKGRAPTGTVEFREGSTVLGQAHVQLGLATLDNVKLASPGSRSITAHYLGDGKNLAGQSAAYSVQVLNTALSLQAEPQTARIDEPVKLSAQVTTAEPGGRVLFDAAGTKLDAPVVNGEAWLYTRFNSTGSKLIKACFEAVPSGPCVSAPDVSVTVLGRTPTTTELTLPPDPRAGVPLTLKAVVSGGSNITGTVTFSVSGSNLAAPVTLVGSVAQLTTTFESVGSRPVMARYSGDLNFEASQQEKSYDVQRQAPTLSVSVTPTGLMAGQPFRQAWSSTHAKLVIVDCTASGTGYKGSFSRALSGDFTMLAQNEWIGYPSTCVWQAHGDGGFSNKVTVVINTIGHGAKPSITVSRAPTPLVVGMTITESWATSPGTTSVSYECKNAANQRFNSTKSTANGSEPFELRITNQGTNTCVWTAVGPGGSSAYTESFVVQPAPTPPARGNVYRYSQGFEPGPSVTGLNVVAGEGYTEMWIVSKNTTSLGYTCTAQNGWQESGVRPLTGGVPDPNVADYTRYVFQGVTPLAASSLWTANDSMYCTFSMRNAEGLGTSNPMNIGIKMFIKPRLDVQLLTPSEVMVGEPVKFRWSTDYVANRAHQVTSTCASSQWGTHTVDGSLATSGELTIPAGANMANAAPYPCTFKAINAAGETTVTLPVKVIKPWTRDMFALTIERTPTAMVNGKAVTVKWTGTVNPRGGPALLDSTCIGVDRFNKPASGQAVVNASHTGANHVAPDGTTQHWCKWTLRQDGLQKQFDEWYSVQVNTEFQVLANFVAGSGRSSVFVDLRGVARARLMCSYQVDDGFGGQDWVERQWPLSLGTQNVSLGEPPQAGCRVYAVPGDPPEGSGAEQAFDVAN